MKKLVILASVAAVAVAVPAQAHKGDGGTGHGKGASQGESKKAGKGKKGKKCLARYVAGGLYVAGTFTQTEGADTEKRRDDRYSGTVTVDVKRANKRGKADVGTTKTYTLANVKVRFADTNDDGTRDAPVAGDRVKVKGWVTRDNERCNAGDADPELTIKDVKFGSPPAPETEAAPTS